MGRAEGGRGRGGEDTPISDRAESQDHRDKQPQQLVAVHGIKEPLL